MATENSSQPNPVEMENGMELSNAKTQKIEQYCLENLSKDTEELLLNEELANKGRYCMFPIKFPIVFDAYNKHLSMFWRASEIQFQEDQRHWEEKLNQNERNFLKHVLAFFAQSDGIVSENVSQNFNSEIVIPEARAFYSMQNLIEYVHSEVYSLMIDVFIKNEKEKEFLFDAINTMPVIKKKADWMFKWMNRETAPFPMRLVAFAVVEGVFFSGSFCSIFWVRANKKILPGLCKSNDFISRDESVHTQFAVLLYVKYVKNKVPEEIIHYMFEEAINIEVEFINQALRVDLLGIKQTDMAEYVRYCGDKLLQQLGYNKLYNAKQPFTFMEGINQEIKQNFFENRPTEYQIADVVKVEDDDGEF